MPSQPSQPSQRFTLFLAMTALVMSSVYLHAANTPATATAPTTGPARADFPTVGLSLIPPPGWTEELNPGPEEAAHWKHLDPLSHLFLGEIKINVNWGAAPDKKDLAHFAEGIGGTLAPQTYQIDHAPAYAIKKDQTNDGTDPQLRLVCSRPHFYLSFIAQGKDGPVPARELVALCKSVKWEPVKNPIDVIELPQSPRSLFDGHIAIALPPLFRASPMMTAPNGISHLPFSILNHKIGQTDVTLGIDYIPADPNLSADNSPSASDPDAKTDPLRPLLKAARPADLDQATADLLPNGLASKPFDASGSAEPGAKRARVRVIEIYGDHSFVRLSLSVYTDDEAVFQQWDKALLPVAESVRFTQPTTAPKTDTSFPLN